MAQTRAKRHLFIRRGPRARAGAFALLALAATSCSKKTADVAATGVDASVAATGPTSTSTATPTPADGAVGLSAPIAAARVDGGVVVAGLDVPSHAVRVQWLGDGDVPVRQRLVFEGVAWTADAELKLLAVADGVAVVWRGKRGDRAVRQVLVLDRDLRTRVDALDVPVGVCATRDALWFTDGQSVSTMGGRPSPEVVMKLDAEGLELSCGDHRAFAVADRDDDTVLWVLSDPKKGDAAAPTGDASSKGDASPKGTAPKAEAAPKPSVALRGSDLGGSEQRDRAVFTNGDDVGIVRIAESGAVAVRESRDGKLGAVHKLARTFRQDDDVIGIDATARAFFVFFARESGADCTSEGGAVARTSVFALRVDRTTFAEDVFELTPGTCGLEIGPFFTGNVGDGVVLSWAERASSTNKSEPPIAALSYRRVPASGTPAPPQRIVSPADALVDGGCASGTCFVVALGRKPGDNGMQPGTARVLRVP